MVRVKLDENVPDAVATILRELGHDVELAREEGLAGAPDADVLAKAIAEVRVLVTLDLDFADVVRHDPKASPGVVVLRPHLPLLPLIVAVARSAGALLGSEEIEGRLWVVDEVRIRVWPGWRPT